MDKTKKLFAQNHHLIDWANIFRPTQDGRKQENVVYFYKPKDKNITVEIKMDQQLSIYDQDIYLTILSQIFQKNIGKIVEIDESTIPNGTNFEKTLYYETNFYKLLKDAYKDPDRTSNQLRNSLKRLANTRINYENHETGEFCYGLSLMSVWGKVSKKPFFVFGERIQDTEIRISIHPLLASLFLNPEDEVKYRVFYLLDQRNKLNDLEKAIYSFLCRKIKIGTGIKNISIEHIYNGVWGYDKDLNNDNTIIKQVTTKTIVNRKTKIKKHLLNVLELDEFKFSEGNEELFNIYRKDTRSLITTNFVDAGDQFNS